MKTLIQKRKPLGMTGMSCCHTPPNILVVQWRSVTQPEWSYFQAFYFGFYNKKNIIIPAVKCLYLNIIVFIFIDKINYFYIVALAV